MHSEILMRHTVYTDPHGNVATLTTDSPVCYPELLVLRLEGPDKPTRDFSPAEILPSGLTAAQQVVRCSATMDQETRALAVLFLRQWPAGPQL